MGHVYVVIMMTASAEGIFTENRLNQQNHQVIENFHKVRIFIFLF